MIDAAFAPVAAAVEAGRIPGAALGLVSIDGDSAVRFAGMAALVPERDELTRDHWFDLASLSKVIATTTIILRLAEQGRLDLDRPLTDAIPDLRQYDVANAAERRLTFRDCLMHRTFLPAVEPLYTYGDDPARLRAFVLQREWPHGPPVYSDINFILRGIAVERLTGAPLSDWSLGDGLGFGSPPGPAVATEHCSWRGRVMKGDEAHAWGFYNHLVAPDEIGERAQALAQSLADGPTFAHAMTKTMLEQEWTMSVDQAIEAEAQAQAICMQTEDFRRAYEAFAAKQKPVFQGD